MNPGTNHNSQLQYQRPNRPRPIRRISPPFNSDGLLSPLELLRLQRHFDRQQKCIRCRQQFRELLDRIGIDRAPGVMAATASVYLAAVVTAMFFGFSGAAAVICVNLIGATVLAAGAWAALGADDETLDELSAACQRELNLLRRSTLHQQ